MLSIRPLCTIAFFPIMFRGIILNELPLTAPKTVFSHLEKEKYYNNLKCFLVFLGSLMISPFKLIFIKAFRRKKWTFFTTEVETARTPLRSIETLLTSYWTNEDLPYGARSVESHKFKLILIFLILFTKLSSTFMLWLYDRKVPHTSTGSLALLKSRILEWLWVIVPSHIVKGL